MKSTIIEFTLSIERMLQDIILSDSQRYINNNLQVVSS